LEGLDCANCSAKIEKEINDCKGVNANINFATKILSLEYANDEFSLDKVKEIVKKYEPDVEVIDRDAHNKGKTLNKNIFEENKSQILRLIVSLFFLVLGAILDLDTRYTFVLFMISYLVAGGDIILRAVRNITRGMVFDENFLMSIATMGAFIIGEYTEGVAVMLFYQVGELFQD